MKDLEKIIGRDIKQAENFAESLDKAVGNLQQELRDLEDRQKLLLEKLRTEAQKAAEAWGYVKILREAEKID